MNREEEIRKEFVERYKGEFEGTHSFLITLVGGSPEPLIRTILCVKPEKVGFLYTEEMNWALDNIVEETGLKPSQVEPKEIDGSRVEEVYEAIGAWTRNYEGDICVDISGGKKAMVGGAVVASSFYDLAMVYNDFREYDVELRRPKQGSEFLTHLTNPFETSQDMLYKLAQVAFNQYDYVQALQLLEEASKKTRDIRRSKESDVLKNLASAYLAWDTFRFEEARKRISAAMAEIEQFELPVRVAGKKLEEHERILCTLSKLTASTYYPEVLKAKEKVKHLVFSCIASAKRREESARYEDAVLRLYRACELIAQHRLALRDVNTAEVSENVIGHDVVKRYKEKKSELFSGKPDEYSLRERIGLMDSYILLDAFRDPLIEGVTLKSLSDAIEVRNQSWVEHGIRVVKKKDFTRMEQEVDKIVTVFCTLYGLNRNEEEEKHTFSKLA
jgi:CRISPR-associated protein (TIGR02710 family)